MKAVVRTLVVAVLVAAALSVGVPSPAVASTAGPCVGTRGILVVVDYHGLSTEPVHQICDTSGQTNAEGLFRSHFQLVNFKSGTSAAAVCQINGLPANDSCYHLGNPYWSLWWSGPTDNAWHYSDQGVGGLQVPAGGSVAFSWTNTSNSTPPSVRSQYTPATKPVTSTSPKPTATSRPSAAHQSAMTSPTQTPTATATATATASPRASASTSASGSPTAAPTDSSGPAYNSSLQIGTSPSRGLDWWVAPAIIVLLGIAGGAIWFVRRRS